MQMEEKRRSEQKAKRSYSLNQVFCHEQRSGGDQINLLGSNATKVKVAAKRRRRSDKLEDIKIPLVDEYRGYLRAAARQYRMERRDQTTVTDYNSLLIIRALNRVQSNADLFPEVPYDPKQKKMTVKLTSLHYEAVFELSIKWGISVRETAHRLIVGMIRQGALL